MRSFLIFALSLLIHTSSIAQLKVLKANRMLDVETGNIISPASIVIDGNKIIDINPNRVPRNAEVIDLGDMTLLPGVMDMHTHLDYQLGPTLQIDPVTKTTSDHTINATIYSKRTLMAGFTTVRNLGSRDFIDVSLSKASDSHTIPAPRVFPGGHFISITGGHGDIGGFKPGILEGDYRTGIADGEVEARKAVRYQIKYGAKVIKFMATAGVLSFEGPVGAQQYPIETMKAIIDEANLHGVKVAAHAHGTDGIIAAVKAGVHSIEHGSMLTDEAISLMKENGTYLVPTTYLVGSIDLEVLPPLLKSKAEFVLPQAVASLKKAITEGVNIAFGTDAGVYPHGDNGKEFAVLVERGMTPLQSIQSATVSAADLLGVTDRGLLKVGLLADIIAVKGNPLEQISVMEDVQFVMKDGVVYKNNK